MTVTTAAPKVTVHWHIRGMAALLDALHTLPMAFITVIYIGVFAAIIWELVSGRDKQAGALHLRSLG